MLVRDSLSGGTVEVGENGRVGLYVCGITPYDFCHVGHARSAVAFDIVQRWLKARRFRSQ